MLTKHFRLYDTANRVYVEIKEDESQKQMNHLQTFLLRLTYGKKMDSNWT
jgi:folate-binding Fe-S cluster repair protein YgfZ